MIEIAIVGLGSWGLSVLERTVSRVRASHRSVRVHVVQPGPLGGGVYSLAQPDYLVLNNACGQLALYATPDSDVDPPYAASLHEWAVRRGYRWHGYACTTEPGGEPIRPTDYLPRRLMGEYLEWFYAELVASAPANLDIVRHAAAASDIVAAAGGRERVLLDNGVALEVDHVVLTSGHTLNEEPAGPAGGVVYKRPYPVEYFAHHVPPATSIAVSGMGLVAFDLVTAMTIGRGGTFSADGARLRYERSGREPRILLYSRSGVPYCAKSAEGVDPTGDYQPVICTAEVFASLRGTSGARRQIDFRADLLPLLFAEMTCRYHIHASFRRGGEAASIETARELRVAWADGRFEKVIEALEGRDGHFDAPSHMFAGNSSRFASSSDYESWVYDTVERDLAEALADGGSPVKAAHEVTRILRDQLRSVIEYGGLTLDSYVDFQSNIRGRINRIEAGPPPMRSQQLLALMDAGVVRAPFGPSPSTGASPDGPIAVRSTQLDRLHATTVSAVVRGHLDMPSLARTASPLLRRLYAKGRLTQLSYGDTMVGSVAISEDFHPFDSEGRLQRNLSLLGVLTEGVRYFTHYLPSPRSRIRAVLDAQACVEALIS